MKIGLTEARVQVSFGAIVANFVRDLAAVGLEVSSGGADRCSSLACPTPDRI